MIDDRARSARQPGAWRTLTDKQGARRAAATGSIAGRGQQPGDRIVSCPRNPDKGEHEYRRSQCLRRSSRVRAGKC